MTAVAQVRAALERGDLEGAERAFAALPSDLDASERGRVEALLRFAHGDAARALQQLVGVLARDGQNAGAWNDLGRLYLNLRDPGQAAQAFRRAVTVAPDDAEGWAGAGVAFDALGLHAEAVEAFGQALRCAPSARTRLHYAAALLAFGDAASAEREVARVRSEVPDDGDASFVHGEALAALGRHAEAAVAFEHAVERGRDPGEASYNRALALYETGALEDAARACERALEFLPTLDTALAQLVHLKRRLCEWQGLEALSHRLRERVRAGSASVTPFSFLAEPASALEQRKCAEAFAKRKLAEVEGLRRRTVFPPRGVSGGRPRVGFVSSGFNNHPTALLTVDLVERLRHGELTTVGFATTRDDGGALRTRIAGAFHEFQDFAGLSHAAMAGRIYDARIDVLVDLRGYGGGGVTEVFALRPAPIQVNWLAYPGTSGAPFIDYLIADRHVVPPAHRAAYSEAVAFLPGSFQPSDTTRVVGTPPPRAECGLPEHGFVYASFNNGYKIGPEVFAAWMRVLRAAEDSVLWLLATGNARTRANLEAAAAAAGVASSRLIFSPKLPHEIYLARYRHVDLFLDTWPYGAHTTASDALWAGVPLLTLPGETFASRVGLSLLTTLDLPELVARDVDDYVAKATAFARDPALAERTRARLSQARVGTPLFDMAGFARDFTTAIRTMVERARYARPPQDFSVERSR